jgi:hypothetical protein
MYAKTVEIDEFIVGDEVFSVKCFPYPEHNEIDFEVWTCGGEYLFTITSNRPDLSTSVLWRYIKGIPTDAVVYSTKDSNV